MPATRNVVVRDFQPPSITVAWRDDDVLDVVEVGLFAERAATGASGSCEMSITRPDGMKGRGSDSRVVSLTIMPRRRGASLVASEVDASAGALEPPVVKRESGRHARRRGRGDRRNRRFVAAKQRRITQINDLCVRLRGTRRFPGVLVCSGTDRRIIDVRPPIGYRRAEARSHRCRDRCDCGRGRRRRCCWRCGVVSLRRTIAAGRRWWNACHVGGTEHVPTWHWCVTTCTQHQDDSNRREMPHQINSFPTERRVRRVQKGTATCDRAPTR